MVNRFYQPVPELAPFVKGYQIAHIQTPAGLPLQTYPFPPHAVQNLSFYTRDPIEVFYHRTGQTSTLPDCVLIGPQVSRVDLTMGRDMLIIATFFEPGGLYRLLGIPMVEFFDHDFDVSLLWNAEIRQINEQLRNASDYDEMKHIVETFLLHHYRQQRTERHPIDTVFRYLEDPTQPVSLDYLADQSCFSARQFERKCYEHLGLSPRLFRRLARFSNAFRLKVNQPDLDWLDIALRYGYYDLRHMRRDFKQFTGVAPSIILREETYRETRPYSSHHF